MVFGMWCGLWNVAFGMACSMHLVYGIWSVIWPVACSVWHMVCGMSYDVACCVLQVVFEM